MPLFNKCIAAEKRTIPRVHKKAQQENLYCKNGYYLFRCEPSQKGLFADFPQRHKKTLSMVESTCPSTPLTVKLPSTIRGPSLMAVTLVLSGELFIQIVFNNYRERTPFCYGSHHKKAGCGSCRIGKMR